MVDWLAELAVTPPGLCSPRLQRDLANHDPASEFEDRSTAETVDARTFTIWLNEQFPDDRTVVTDVGGFMSIPLKHLRVTDPRACVLPANFGSVGLSMGATIGAAIARPDRPVVAVTGDGGFMMGGLTEFNTAVRYGVDAVVAVL
jgi:thiamine pyrophosphate-dependent acetolactate synthase large subunit-like protein